MSRGKHILVVSVVVLAFSAIPAVAQAASVAVSASNSSVATGEPFSFSVTGVADQPLYSSVTVYVFLLPRADGCAADEADANANPDSVMELQQSVMQDGPFSFTRSNVVVRSPGSYLLCAYIVDDITLGTTATGSTALSVLAPPPPDRLVAYGRARLRPPSSRIYAFRASCNALPCTIKLSERAFAHGKHLTGLDRTGGPVITIDQQPPANRSFVVWFTKSDLNQHRLSLALQSYGSVQLHVSGLLSDANSKSVATTRTISLLGPKPKSKPRPPKPLTLQQQAVKALRDYLNNNPQYLGGSDPPEISCQRITTNRFRCKWFSAPNHNINVSYGRGGTADVTKYQYAWQVDAHLECSFDSSQNKPQCNLSNVIY